MSSQSKALLDLGKKLVNELGLDQSVDTLSRWMAHYLAELILDAESAEAEDKPSKQAKCVETILELWRRRTEFPSGRRLENVEPILRALESLDPCDKKRRYFPWPRMVDQDAEPETEAGKWLKLADGLDYTARLLIRHCLQLAAQNAVDESKEWVDLAKSAGVEDDVEIRVLRMLSDEATLMGRSEGDDSERKIIEDRIAKLEDFQEMAAELLAKLRQRLAGDE